MIQHKSRIDKTEYTFEKYRGGSMFWYKNDEYHRDNDLPAVIYNNGSMFWHKNGKLHREKDHPAIIYYDGDMDWYKNGEFIKGGKRQ